MTGRTESAARHAALPIALLLLLAQLGCTSPGTEPNTSARPPFIEAGDLDQMKRRGTLRILLPLLDRNGHLPRGGSPLDSDRELISAFAEREGLQPFWIPVRARSDLIPYLLAGKGDLIAADLTVTDERRKLVAFTVPIKLVREQVVARAQDLAVREPADLVGRRVAVRRSSSFYRTLKDLNEKYPGIEIEEAPEELDTDELIHRVANRRFDLTVADNTLLAATLSYRKDVRIACDLTDDLPVAWAMRPDSTRLLRKLNRFISDAQLTRRRNELRTGDLNEIRDKRVLRLLTRNSAATYFLWRGKLMGFEYELAREFAKSQGLRLDVVVPQRGESLLGMLVEGRGDLVGAGLTPSELQERMGVYFSRPYNYASHVVVEPVADATLTGPADLAGRSVYVKQSSAYWHTLGLLRMTGVPLIMQAAPEHLETEGLIDLVARGVYDLTVADSHIVDIELTWRDDVKGAFTLGDPVPLAWAVRKSNPGLLKAVNEFLDREYRGVTYNVLYRKYFKDSKKIRRHVEFRSRNGDLSPYDGLVKRYAEQHDFDWRLIVSQMYQESEFDPRARSFAGAVGLLQVMPRTARERGVTKLTDPETNIRVGLEYLTWVRDRFEDDLPVRDRMWFTLAAYNVGQGHVRDARRLATEQGLDPDKWFDNVEQAILLLSQPEHARAAQHGYCRGREPVQYVREIRSRYEAYLETLSTEQTVGLPGPGPT